VFFIPPVQAHEGGIDWRSRRGGYVLLAHNWRCVELELRTRWLGLSEGLIAETSDCPHLSIRLESKRRAGAKLWADSSHETGCVFVIQRGVAWRGRGPFGRGNLVHKSL
jgi:hypothetical protein